MDDRTIIEWDKDDLDARRHAEGRRARARHADLHPPRLRLHAAALRLGADPRHDPGRGPGRLRHDLPRRHDRRLPDREPRADDHAAAAQAAQLLRPRHRGGDRPPRPDPGRHGASLSPPPAGDREGALPAPVARARSGGRTGEGARPHARRAALPGAGDEDRHRRGEIHRRRGRQAAPRHGDLQARRHHRHVPDQDDRGHGRPRLRARLRRALLPARSRALANTASRRATPRASPSSSTPRPGSSATTPTSSAPPSSTPSRWASTPRPRSSATRAPRRRRPPRRHQLLRLGLDAGADAPSPLVG